MGVRVHDQNCLLPCAWMTDGVLQLLKLQNDCASGAQCRSVLLLTLCLCVPYAQAHHNKTLKFLLLHRRCFGQWP